MGAAETGAAWNDPAFLRAVMYLGLLTAGAIVFVGLPQLFKKERPTSWPLLLMGLAFIGTSGAIGGYLEYAGEGPSAHLLPPGRRALRSAPSGLDRILEIPTVIPNVEAVLKELPGFLAGMNEALGEVNPMLVKVNAILEEMRPLLGEVRDALGKVDKAERALDEIMPLLEQASLAMRDVTPLLSDIRRLMAEVNLAMAGRDTVKTAGQIFDLIESAQEALTAADVVLRDLAFLDENWIRHFLQVEGIRAHAGFGTPDIPAGSVPHLPPPLRRK